MRFTTTVFLLSAFAGCFAQAPLTNEAVITMLRDRTSEAAVIEKIKNSPANFQLDGEHLAKLKENNVPSSVLRAMLNRRTTPAEPPPTQPLNAPVEVVVKDPGPAIAAVQTSAGPTAAIDSAIARQADRSIPLADRAQTIMFVKSDTTDPKQAIANVLISQVGVPLLTMGLSTQMKMWNPYMGEALTKASNLGLGVLLGHGVDTKGFEFEMLPGLRSQTALQRGPAEFLIPLNRYVSGDENASADVQLILVRLQARDQDQARLIASRRILLKENKKGRFDLKPTVERQESDFQQTTIDIEAHRDEGNVYRISPKQPLEPGEYALIFRKKADTGAYTANVALRPMSSSPAQETALPPNAPQPGKFSGLMRHGPAMMRPGLPMQTQPPAPRQQVTGFIAWDFRVE